MKTLLKVLFGLVLALVLCAGGAYAWASHEDNVLLSRRIKTPHVDFPIPFPLSNEALDSLRRAGTAEGARGDPLAGLNLDSIAMAQAVARGDHLVHARYGCVECHGKNFGGGVMVDSWLIGRLLGPNITAGKGGVTAGFAASDWDRIVRRGVKPNGRPAVMPSADFQSMSDEELSDIVAYIRSLPTVNDTVPPPHFGPLGRVLLATGKIRLAVDEIADPMASHAKYPPKAGTTRAFGQHLAATCMGCHGKDLSGGPIPGGDPSWPPAANLTPAADGLAGWTFEQFATVLRTGKKPDGTAVRSPMSKMVAYGKQMTDVELKALWDYVSTVPPVASKK